VRAGETLIDREPGPGRHLRDARESLGATVREVAESLNLSIAVVQALEADDYARLPGPVFTRGYVRAYARLLRIDPQPLLASCHYGPDDAAPSPPAAEPPLREWIRRRPGVVLGGAAAGLGLLVVAALLLLWPAGSPGIDSASETAQPAAAAVAEASPQPSPAPGTEALPGALAPEGALAAEDALAPAGTLALLPESRAAAADGVRITTAGEDRLQLSFIDDCWIEVRGADGAMLYSNLSRGGSELVLVGQGPFRILLGYAPGVTMRYNGEPVPLEAHTRNNVATLVLGH
jgi:cytoskeleton protein RodZ